MSAPNSLEPAQLETLRGLIKRFAGLRIDATGLSFALSRAWPTLAERGVTDVPALINELSFASGRLWLDFLPFVTINETYFMREASQLAVFKDLAIPNLIKMAAKRGDPTLRILSAACSTGEEPYSLAILLAESGCVPEVLGIDIDPAVIAHAQAGIYGPHSFRGTTDIWRKAHFEPLTAGTWQVAPAIQKRVQFRRQNVLAVETALAGHRYHAIFCRNVLIYFERQTQLDVVRQLGRLLLPGGYLCLGHSELFFGEDLGLSANVTDRATIYQRQEQP
jgi:chemotaxis protein methyltransferase CheR